MAMPAISVRHSASSFRRSVRPGTPWISRRRTPSTYQKYRTPGLQDPRIHALILGYCTPSSRRQWYLRTDGGSGLTKCGRKASEKPVVASLRSDVEVEEAAEYLYQHGFPAYAYSTEIPVAVLGAKYKWARRRPDPKE